MNLLHHVCLFVSVALFLGGCTGNDTLGDQGDSLSDFQPADGDCADLFSFNDNWADNCVLKHEGLYAHSNYSLGIQRILWCLEFSDDAIINQTEEEIVARDQFATGRFDTSTETAVRRYQTARQIQSHGAVGETTWRQLRQELSLLGAAAAEFSSYSINSDRCENVALFFQRNSEPYDWKIVSPENEKDRVEFTALEPSASSN